MLVVVSPAKKLDFSSFADSNLPSTKPAMLKSSQELVAVMQKYDLRKLSELMKVNDKIAEENVKRYKEFSTPFKPSNARQAVLAFNGDTYLGLEAQSLSEEEHEYAQSHLRILSGLYGVLRPLDLIQPYRLEMGLKLKTEKGDSIYDFWGEKITARLNRELAACGSEYLLNCASNEYIGAIQQDKLRAKVITPVFKQVKNGETRMLGMMAKRARGAMARFVVQNQVSTPKELESFKVDGYRFQRKLSDEQTMEFHRKA